MGIEVRHAAAQHAWSQNAPLLPIAVGMRVRRAAERYRSSLRCPAVCGSYVASKRGMTAVGWHRPSRTRHDPFDPTSLGGRSSTPQRVKPACAALWVQAHWGHGAIFIPRAAAHQSRWVLQFSWISTRKHREHRARVPVSAAVWTPTTPRSASSREIPSAPTRIDDVRFERGCCRRNRRPSGRRNKSSRSRGNTGTCEGGDPRHNRLGEAARAPNQPLSACTNASRLSATPRCPMLWCPCLIYGRWPALACWVSACSSGRQGPGQSISRPPTWVSGKTFETPAAFRASCCW